MTFESIIDRVLDHEGSYTSGTGDPGGETKWGISKRSYPHLNIKILTREQAIAIYRTDFWDRMHLDCMPDGVAFQLLDFAINSGIETTVRYFQRVVGTADDGHWGPMSQEAANLMAESDMIMGLCAERLEFMTKLKNWPTHGKGWARRIAQNLRYGSQDS